MKVSESAAPNSSALSSLRGMDRNLWTFAVKMEESETNENFFSPDAKLLAKDIVSCRKNANFAINVFFMGQCTYERICILHICCVI